MTTPQGDTTDVTLTIVPEDGTYLGVITGFAASTEIRLSRVSATEAELTVAGATETAFGPLAFVYALTREDAVLSGGGRVTLGAHGFDVSLELTRARRTDVLQPQVEQQIDYFAGEWRFEYTGGEFPPLSIGTRSGTVTFRDLPDAPFVEGTSPAMSSARPTQRSGRSGSTRIPRPWCGRSNFPTASN